MTYPERYKYAHELGLLAIADPSAYASRLRRMVRIGQFLLHGAFLIGVLLIFGVMVWGFIGWLNVWVALVLVITGIIVNTVLYQALYFEIPEPSGLTLPRELYPLLFKDLRDLRKKLKAPRFHEVLFTMDFGAAMVQVPQQNGLLPSKNFLLIGIPLLFTSTREEFLAILAHELAHLSGNHSRSTGGAYTLRLRVLRVIEHLTPRAQHFRINLLLPPLLRFFERLEIVTLALSRQHEIEADRQAAKTSDPRLCSRSLCKAIVLSRYWNEDRDKEIARRMIQSKAPDISMLRDFLALIKTPGAQKQLHSFLPQAMHERADVFSTHPSLRERLTAMGVEPELELHFDDIAAKRYFERDSDKLIERFDRTWISHMIKPWETTHLGHQRNLTHYMRLTRLIAKGEKLTPTELWTIAVIEEQSINPSKAVAAYERFLAEYPDELAAQLALGRILLETAAPRAEKHLKEVLARHPLLWTSAGELLLRHYERIGQTGEADEIKRLIEKHTDHWDVVIDERITMKKKAKYKVQQLPPRIIEGLYKLAGELETVDKLWVLEREVTLFKESPAFLIIFEPTLAARNDPEQVLMTKIFFSNECYTPGTNIVRPFNQCDKSLQALAKKTEGAEIFSKED